MTKTKTGIKSKIFTRAQTGLVAKIPVVYHPRYNSALHLKMPSFAGLDKIAALESGGPGQLNALLIDSGLYRAEQLTAPILPETDDLLLAHTPAYLALLKKPVELSRIFESSALAHAPSFLAYKAAMTPVLYQTGGTITAAQLAQKHGWAINLGGGASRTSAERAAPHSPLADIAMAVFKIRRDNPQISNIMIIDLCAEQASGLGRDFTGDPALFAIDFFSLTDSGDEAVPAGTGNAGIFEYMPDHIDDESYLYKLKDAFEKAEKRFTPDIIFYNAGHNKKPAAAAHLLTRRDEMVFAFAFKNAAPVVMTLGSPYNKENAGASARSLINLNNRFGLF